MRTGGNVDTQKQPSYAHVDCTGNDFCHAS